VADVRFAAHYGLKEYIAPSPKSATTELMHRSKDLAIHHLVGAGEKCGPGTVRPSALAVLSLMTSSNLVGCSIGRSAGFIPFRMLRRSSQSGDSCP
jgi:hypothetical protein